VHETPVLDATDGGLPDGDDLLGRAVRFLIDGGDDKAAAILVESRLRVRVDVFHDGDEWGNVFYRVTYVVEAPRAGYNALRQLYVPELDRDWKAHAVGESIRQALNAVTPANVEVWDIDARFDQTPAVKGWREDVSAFLLGQETHNQASSAPGPMRMLGEPPLSLGEREAGRAGSRRRRGDVPPELPRPCDCRRGAANCRA
jgi:hypothetical protein